VPTHSTRISGLLIGIVVLAIFHESAAYSQLSIDSSFDPRVKPGRPAGTIGIAERGKAAAEENRREFERTLQASKGRFDGTGTAALISEEIENRVGKKYYNAVRTEYTKGRGQAWREYLSFRSNPSIWTITSGSFSGEHFWGRYYTDRGAFYTVVYYGADEIIGGANAFSDPTTSELKRKTYANQRGIFVRAGSEASTLSRAVVQATHLITKEWKVGQGGMYNRPDRNQLLIPGIGEIIDIIDDIDEANVPLYRVLVRFPAPDSEEFRLRSRRMIGSALSRKNVH